MNPKQGHDAMSHTACVSIAGVQIVPNLTEKIPPIFDSPHIISRSCPKPIGPPDYCCVHETFLPIHETPPYICHQHHAENRRKQSKTKQDGTDLRLVGCGMEYTLPGQIHIFIPVKTQSHQAGREQINPSIMRPWVSFSR